MMYDIDLHYVDVILSFLFFFFCFFLLLIVFFFFFFSSRRRHTRLVRDWSSDVCSSDLRQVTVILDSDSFDEENPLLASLNPLVTLLMMVLVSVVIKRRN